MSIDWSDMSTPLETRDWKGWDIDFVVAITAGLCYELGQTVEPEPTDWDYTRNPPLAPNPAHCNVRGSKSPKIKEIFLEACSKVSV